MTTLLAVGIIIGQGIGLGMIALRFKLVAAVLAAIVIAVDIVILGAQ